MGERERCGRHYWVVKTSLSRDGEARLWADACRVTGEGLVFYGVSGEDRGPDAPGVVVASFAPGFYGASYLADPRTGRPAAFDHWPEPA